MSGYDCTDLGNRVDYHATNRTPTMDRFCDKFPWQSPYCISANNPVNYIDVNGDSINVHDIQNYDNTVNTNYTNTINKEWNDETGLSVTVSQNGDVSYAKDKNGNPIIATQTDKNGNTTQKGSKTARDLLMKTIDSKDMITVSPDIVTGKQIGRAHV